MKKWVFLFLCMFMAACSTTKSQPEPYAPEERGTESVYYSQFQDIPIVQGMDVDPDRTYISIHNDGSRIGLVTFEGNMEKSSLMDTMTQNMMQQGWTIISSIMGPRAMQIYKKGELYSVLYYYDQLASIAMEVWVGVKVNEGAYVPVRPVSPQAVQTSGSHSDDGAFVETFDNNVEADPYSTNSPATEQYTGEELAQ